jgi:hypothetical protein
MLLYQVGEFFEDLATSKSKKAITDAIDLRDQKASVIEKDERLPSRPRSNFKSVTFANSRSARRFFAMARSKKEPVRSMKAR